MELKDNALANWIIQIIDSCNNDFHFDAVDRLIELFYEKEKNEELKVELMLLKQNKWNEIHNILM